MVGSNGNRLGEGDASVAEMTVGNCG